MATKIEWTKITHDINGNPRYVCHYLNLLTEEQKNISNVQFSKYEWALERARKIGGKRFHNKQYGGGIVFQSYSLEHTEESIRRVLEG